MGCEDFDAYLLRADDALKLTERIYRGWEHYPEDGIYPLVASASFASVYYLKALLIFRSPVFELEDSEDLLILFENLPQVDQDAIKMLLKSRCRSICKRQ